MVKKVGLETSLLVDLVLKLVRLICLDLEVVYLLREVRHKRCLFVQLRLCHRKIVLTLLPGIGQ